MSPRDVSRAARAIFDIVHAKGEGARAVASVEQLVALMDEYPDLHRALVSPFVPPAARRGVVDALAPRLDMPDAVRQSLGIIAEQGVMSHLPALARILRQLVNRAAGIVEAAVTTAVPLSPAQLDLLQARLSDATGKQVAVTAKVDPAVIGGVVARVGGLVYDGSLARQLARLQQQLVQRG